jgi:O-antigen chain-terminating methyltransferase
MAKTDADLVRELEQTGTHLRNLQTQADRLGVHINNLQGFVDKHSAEATAVQRGLEQRLNDQAGLQQKISGIEERTADDAAFIKGQLSEYGGVLRRLLGADSQPPAAADNKLKASKPSASKADLALDSFYLSFENRFRGPRSEIKKRVAFYLPFLRKAKAGASGRPVLDIGCGRGEWLELLKENNLEAEGLDLNKAMVSHCKSRRLKVRLGDALEHLHSSRANSKGAVTGFHIIEHLSFEVLMELFRETRRVLKPGGVAIFESPNCKNLIVGASTFHIDPTHQHPVFPDTAEFMLASHGFERIEIVYLSPVPDPKFKATTAELSTIKDLLYGPQDFGIVAFKPKAR